MIMTSQGVLQQKRIFGYDALKALAAFFVVLYHVGMVDFGYQPGQYYYPNLTQILWLFCACGVPLFFMVNGALTVDKNYSLKKSAHKAGKLLFSGIVWGVVVMCLLAARYHDMTRFAVHNLSYYWFLFTLAALYIISFLIGKLPLWRRWAIVAILLAFPFMTNLIWDVIQLRDPGITLPKWGHSGAFTLYGVVYLYVGNLLASRRINKWLVIACAVLGLGLLTMEAIAVVNHTKEPFEGGNYCFPTVGALLLSSALFIWIKDWNLKDSWLKRYITFLGNNALGIYIFHLILMIIIGWLFPSLHGVNVHPLLAILITLAYTTASALISEGLRHTPLAFLLKL